MINSLKNKRRNFGQIAKMRETVMNLVSKETTILHIQNPSFPSAYSSQTALTYTINKCSSDVCSVRLDFESFTIEGPADTIETGGGACMDSFQATGTSGIATPIICGMNTGQHSKCIIVIHKYSFENENDTPCK